MGKLRLDVDDVHVESFVTATPSEMRGTVRAKSDTYLWCNSFHDTCWNNGCNTGITAQDYCPTAPEETCAGWGGCDPSGQNSAYTCEGTCSDYGCTVCNAWC